MKSSWQSDPTGHVMCRWSGLVQPIRYDATWTPSDIQTSYLPPLLLDFASHSPFGGACWFHPRPADCLRRYTRFVAFTEPRPCARS